MANVVPVHDDLTSNTKLFTNDISLFSVVQNINSTANDLNSDLMKISEWAFQWKIRFNPDPEKHINSRIIKKKHCLAFGLSFLFFYF